MCQIIFKETMQFGAGYDKIDENEQSLQGVRKAWLFHEDRNYF